ncbi:unnamed protein product [Prunus armeniaca]
MAYFGETQLFGAKDSEGSIFSTWTLHGGPSGSFSVFDMTIYFAGTGAWDLALLTNHLCGEDKKAITNIALGSIAQLGDTNTGASKKLVALSQCNENFDIGGSDFLARQSFWKQLWKLELPSKIKNLVWRACLDILPTAVNLYKRKVVQSQSLLTGRLGEWRELWSYMEVTNPVWCGPSCLGCLDQSNEIDRLCIPLFLIVMVLWTVKEKGEAVGLL